MHVEASVGLRVKRPLFPTDFNRNQNVLTSIILFIFLSIQRLSHDPFYD
jgi:hypothetical protein